MNRFTPFQPNTDHLASHSHVHLPMSHIKVIPLGAGQDVGRSCIIVSIGGKNIMFDCGMHMGYNDERRFPNFKYLSPESNFDQVIDLVVISHFHLDHCGALPYFTEMCGYTGPVVMTYPTKAVCPILLEDFRKIMVERKGVTSFFTSAMIKDCMKKVIPVNIHQSLKIGDDIEVVAYYAGHVLGAAMFYVKVGDRSVVYTGDYNMTPDRHLGAAHIDRLKVDLLITETTYATMIRDSKRLRERDFLKKVHQCVEKGGKVLIPVFALGRAQELCVLIETYWERMNLGKIPVYFSAGLVEKANLYYKLFINWTNQKLKETFMKHNMFDFRHIKPFERHYADMPGPMVLFATPGMLHAGMSLDVFKKWCGNELNLCILPGFCVSGTIGNKIMSGSKRVEIDKTTSVDVKLQVRSLSFSAHADAKGIMQLIHQCQPKNVMLVHGEKGKMQFLKNRIISELGIPCFDPANGELLTIPLNPSISVDISRKLINKALIQSSASVMEEERFVDQFDEEDEEDEHNADREITRLRKRARLQPAEMEIEAFLVSKPREQPSSSRHLEDESNPLMSHHESSKDNHYLKLVHYDEASAIIGAPEHKLQFKVGKPLLRASIDQLFAAIAQKYPHAKATLSSKSKSAEDQLIYRSVKDDEAGEWICGLLDALGLHNKGLK